MPVLISTTPLQRPTFHSTVSQVNEAVVQLTDVHADQYATIWAATDAVEHVAVPWPDVIEIEVAVTSSTLVRSAAYPSHWSVPEAYETPVTNIPDHEFVLWRTRRSRRPSIPLAAGEDVGAGNGTGDGAGDGTGIGEDVGVGDSADDVTSVGKDVKQVAQWATTRSN